MIPQRESGDLVRQRDVRQILTAAEVGLVWSDNIGPTHMFTYVDDLAPYTIPMPSSGEPAIVFARVLDAATGRRRSSAQVEWEVSADGRSLVIYSVAVADGSTEYEVTLLMVRGE